MTILLSIKNSQGEYISGSMYSYGKLITLDKSHTMEAIVLNCGRSVVDIDVSKETDFTKSTGPFVNTGRAYLDQGDIFVEAGKILVFNTMFKGVPVIFKTTEAIKTDKICQPNIKLDEDVRKSIEAIIGDNSTSFNEVVNMVLRLGIERYWK